MILTLGLVVVLFLLALSAFFASAETALISLSPQKAKSLALHRPSLAQALHTWLSEPHELLMLILIGNTFVNVLFASTVTFVGVHTFQVYSRHGIEFAAWLASTITVVIFGEMMPKFFARANPERTSLFLLPYLDGIRRVGSPLLKIFSRPLLRFFPGLRSKPIGQVLTFSMEELKALLEEDLNQVAADDSSWMMTKILEINDRRVESIMTPLSLVDYVDLDRKGKKSQDRDFLIDLIIEQGHTRTPVKKNGEFAGFIHSDDLMPLIKEDSEVALESLIRPAMIVYRELSVNFLLNDFRKSGTHIGFVHDEQKNVIGIVTLEDVLEEITGEILDEHDETAETEAERP